MDNQLPQPVHPENAPGPTPGPAEAPGATPENLQAGPAPTPEVGPAGEPGGGPGALPATPAPKLSAADVAAAIAATPTPGAAPATTPTPPTAGDVDVIEPEWVQKAEEVIVAHQGDPYAEEEAIEDLQEDYLQKRYGITVADPNPDDSKPKGT